MFFFSYCVERYLEHREKSFSTMIFNLIINKLKMYNTSIRHYFIVSSNMIFFPFACLDSVAHDNLRTKIRKKFDLELKCLYFPSGELFRFWTIVLKNFWSQNTQNIILFSKYLYAYLRRCIYNLSKHK